MVEVSGLDCGKFWNVQSLSTVIWTGSGCLYPSITPKYGGSLQNFSAPSAGEAIASKKVKRTSSVKPSEELRDIRARGKRHGRSICRGVFQLPCQLEVGESSGHARRPIARRGRYRRNAVGAVGDSSLRRAPPYRPSKGPSRAWWAPRSGGASVEAKFRK